MFEIVEQEYRQFLADIKTKTFVCGRYIDESHYEDEYSHNDIEEAQAFFMKKVKAYLHEKYPGNYVMVRSYCVFIVTPEWGRERNWPEEKIIQFTVK